MMVELVPKYIYVHIAFKMDIFDTWINLEVLWKT